MAMATGTAATKARLTMLTLWLGPAKHLQAPTLEFVARRGMNGFSLIKICS